MTFSHASATSSTTHSSRTTAPSSSSKAAVPIRNPYVKSTSIHSTFQNISAETEKYRTATQQAQAERQALLQRLQTGKKQTNDLAESIRVAQDKLGAVQRDVNMWQRQETMLQNKLTQERQVLQELTTEITACQLAEQQDRRDFCVQMAARNDELGALLQEFEVQRLVRTIHPDVNVDVILSSKSGGGGNNDEDVAMAEDDDTDRQALVEALQELQQTAQDFEGVYAQKEAYENQILEARQQVLQKQSVQARDSLTSGENVVRKTLNTKDVKDFQLNPSSSHVIFVVCAHLFVHVIASSRLPGLKSVCSQSKVLGNKIGATTTYRHNHPSTLRTMPRPFPRTTMLSTMTFR